MQWVITKDRTFREGDADVTGHGNYFLDFPRDKRSWALIDTPPERLRQSLPILIRLSDDDGEVYYDGRISDLEGDSEEAFAPLDWAMSYAGCTSMEYYDKEVGEWKTL